MIVLLIGAVVGIGFWGITKALKSNDPYRESIAAVETNPAAVEALGTPVKPGFFLTGNININNGEGSVDFSIPVSGPKGKGTVHVVGSKSAGASAWTYSTWELNIEGGPSIPLEK
ncbi:MAG TPA: cytochrome c oxidase assembly factor Coa1 family protein [Bacteroidia bacterium]|nr:cytochrome c oxidase assembly factor Coa1 family protein [Bacteroidia bacterium]